MTPSVPSEPITSEVRSSPVTPLTVRWPRRSSRPSASTRSTPSTASRTTPYFAHSRPPAPVAMLPPTVEIARLAGSGAHHRPCSASAALRSALRMPGSTTASRSSGRTSRMRSIAAHRQRDLARAGVRAAGEAGAGAAGDDGRAGLGRDAQGRLHVGDGRARGRRRAGFRMPRAPTCRRVRLRARPASCRRDRRARRAAARRRRRRRSREAAPAGDDADRHGDDAEDETDPGESHAPPRDRRRRRRRAARRPRGRTGARRGRRAERRTAPRPGSRGPVRRCRRRCSTGTATRRSPRSRGSRRRTARTRRRGGRRPTAVRACRVRGAAATASRGGCRTWPPVYGAARPRSPTAAAPLRLEQVGDRRARRLGGPMPVARDVAQLDAARPSRASCAARLERSASPLRRVVDDRGRVARRCRGSRACTGRARGRRSTVESTTA